jgi:hypothetical protein
MPAILPVAIIDGKPRAAAFKRGVPGTDWPQTVALPRSE